MDEFNKELCQERHTRIDKSLDELNKKVSGQVWWFIGIFGTVLASLVKSIMT